MTFVKMSRMHLSGMFLITSSLERARERPLTRFPRFKWREVLTSGRPCIETNSENSDNLPAKRFKRMLKTKTILSTTP